MFIAGGIHQITKAPAGRHVYGIRRGPVPTTLNKKSRGSVCTIPAQVLKGIVLERR